MNETVSRRALLPLSAAVAGSALLASGSVRGQPTITRQGDGVLLEQGMHRVTTNTTLKTDVVVQPGATIHVAAGATLTILGCFQAPVATIFVGPGTVDLNRSRTPHAHPEWWGAVPGDGAQNCLPALQACLAAHPVMHLLPADYFIEGSFVVERPFCQIRGAGFRGTEGWRGTRLVLTTGHGDVMRVGPANRPPTVNDYPQNIEISALALGRSRPVDAASSRRPAGLVAQYLLCARLEQISSNEHAIGFSARGLVRTQLIDCFAFRSLHGTQPGQPWRGFLLDGMDDIGLAGGNASLFLIDCNATVGGDPQVSDGVGLLLEGAFADTFVINFETTAVATGIRADGKAGQIGERGRNGHVNLHLRMPIIDQCGEAGIILRDTSAHMMVDISEPYVATAPNAQAAIRCDAMRGSASISGGQLIGTTSSANGGNAAGLMAYDSDGLQIHGLKLLECPRPVEMSNCRGFSIQGLILNQDFPTRRDAVRLQDCVRGALAMVINGSSRAFASGVRIDGDCHRVRIDATGHDDDAFQNGANGRVRIGDQAVTIPSRYNDILIDGA